MVIMIGGVSLINAQSAIVETNSNSNMALVAQCFDDDGNVQQCGQTCGTVEVWGVEICVCSGECPGGDQPPETQ